MIDPKQITNDKLPFILPKLAVLVLILFFAYVDFSFFFSDLPSQALGIIALLDVVLFTGTLISGLAMLLSDYYHICSLSKTSQTLTILEKAIFSEKYRIKYSIPMSEINDVVVANAQDTRQEYRYKDGFLDLIIQDKNENTVFSKVFSWCEKRIADTTAEDIRKVLNGEAEYYQFQISNLTVYENVFIGFVIFQLLVNVNYIKQLIFGAFM